MENKSVKIIILILTAIVLFILAYLFMAHKLTFMIGLNGNSGTGQRENPAGDAMGSKVIFPEMKCDYENDLNVMDDAVGKADASVCSCAGDSKFKETCVKSVQDSILYDKALDSKDSSICDQMKNKETLKSCKESVLSKIEYEKNNHE